MNKSLSHHQTVEYHGRLVTLIGWREWVVLPQLGIECIKAKIDTGARTSSLHAFGIERYRQRGKDKVRFEVHPKQRCNKFVVECSANLIDIRQVTNSGAQRELRHVIETPIIIAGQEHIIEISLTNRDSMTFRMLLGRKALQNHFIIDPCRSFHT